MDMRYFILVLLVGCSTVPITPVADGGFLGDTGPALPDAGTDAISPDAGLEPVDAGSDAVVLEVPDAGAPAMDQYEVFWGEWRWFTADAGIAPGTGPGCTSGTSDGYPVNCITVELAEAYCASQGQRLPTRVEWLAEAALYPASSDEVIAATGPGTYVHGTCRTRLCDARGNLSELTSDGFVMGGNYADTTPSLDERAIVAPDPRGFRRSPGPALGPEIGCVA